MSTSKILLEIQDMGVIRGLEIYDRPKIFNCNLYHITGQPQQTAARLKYSRSYSYVYFKI